MEWPVDQRFLRGPGVRAALHPDRVLTRAPGLRNGAVVHSLPMLYSLRVRHLAGRRPPWGPPPPPPGGARGPLRPGLCPKPTRRPITTTPLKKTPKSRRQNKIPHSNHWRGPIFLDNRIMRPVFLREIQVKRVRERVSEYVGHRVRCTQSPTPPSVGLEALAQERTNGGTFLRGR